AAGPRAEAARGGAGGRVLSRPGARGGGVTGMPPGSGPGMRDVSGRTLADLDPFAIFDAEAARLDAFFSGLDADGWGRPSRCRGWSVRDVLAHLAGEELYNHACLDDALEELFARPERAGVTGGYDALHDRGLRRPPSPPVGPALAALPDEAT